MIENVISTLQLVATLVGLLPASEVGALGLAVVLVTAVLAAAVVLAGAAPTPGQRSGPHPRRAIDLSSPLAQSDPDAAGHPRSRAPGSGLPAA